MAVKRLKAGGHRGIASRATQDKAIGNAPVVGLVGAGDNDLGEIVKRFQGDNIQIGPPASFGEQKLIAEVITEGPHTAFGKRRDGTERGKVFRDDGCCG